MSALPTRKLGRSWWQVFLACALAVVLALGWITTRFLGLERTERLARAESEHQGSLRLALWRIDSWLGPLLALEAARPYTEYLETETGGQFEGVPDFVLIHFQVDDLGRVTSPELPRGASREPEDTDDLRTHFLTVERLLVGKKIEASLCASERAQQLLQLRIPESSPVVSLASSRTKSDFELGKRQGVVQKLAQSQNEVANRYPFPSPIEDVRLGMFVPLWFESDPGLEPQLMFVRRVILDGKNHFQGFLCSWSALQAGIQEQITDLFPEGRITPAAGSIQTGSEFLQSPDPGTLLATLPASLTAPLPASPGGGGPFQPTRIILGISWLTVLVGLAAVGTAFRSTSELAEKRARFAVAVTHELRTPLTTFRMYTDMLSQGMVTDPKKRDEYIDTLHDESERLARLVENVLAYSQLEQGSRRSQIEIVTVSTLIERLSDPLIRRAESAELKVEFDTTSCRDTEVQTDISAVEQILFNLVDNACKYAGTNSGRPIYVRCRNDGASVCFEVADSGKGVPSGERAKVFAPFERGPSTLDRPGIGLGLALARDLARELGGDLQLQPESEGGACFVLSLPSVAGTPG